MHVDSINNGIVIDHITPGRALVLYNLLGLDATDGTVAIITKVSSRKMGKKDIIKVDADIDVNTDILGYVDPGVTVNVIRNGKITEKKQISLPDKLVNVISCKNPRCITSTEQELPQIFNLSDKQNKIYRCVYCEVKFEDK